MLYVEKYQISYMEIVDSLHIILRTKLEVKLAQGIWKRQKRSPTQLTKLETQLNSCYVRRREI